MSRNSIGKNLVITSFGESHGTAIGAVIDGFPAGFALDLAKVQAQMNRRKPGQSAVTTDRKEGDEIKILSGFFEGKTLGSPIAVMIENQNAISADYDQLKAVYRPGHADLTYDKKYGHRDHRGGGRSSARITAGWVAAGAMAEQYLQLKYKIDIVAYVQRIFIIEANIDESKVTRKMVDASLVRCPDKAISKKMVEAIEIVKKEGDSFGGTIRCVVRNVPTGLGEPVFGKLHAELSKAILSIPSVKAITFGDGIASTYRTGSNSNDVFQNMDGKIKSQTNKAGGINGGISNGEDLIFMVFFKPVSSIAKSQKTINDKGENVELEITGRHDPCVLPRAVPIVEAMTALVLMDMALESSEK